MKLKVLGSSSKGNCYLFEASNKETLVVECGVDFKDVKKATNFNLNNIVGALLTHEHGDHAKEINKFLSAGINVYSAYPTLNKLGIVNNHYAKVLMCLEYQQIGSFRILSFDVKHDAVAPLGFVIYHEEMGNTLFLTDTYYVEYVFADLNNILIEANYDKSLVSEGFLKNRIIQSHMSIDQCIETLKANDLSQVNNIVLIHLSDSNSNAKDFKKRVQQATGKTTTIADRSLIIDYFDKTPF